MVRKQKECSSMKSKAGKFMTDLTTVYFNPISDKPSPPPQEAEIESEPSPAEPVAENGSQDSVKGPDTSFSAFLYSLLAPSDSGATSNLDEKYENREEISEPVANKTMKGSSGKKSLFSRGKQSLGKALNQAVRYGGYRNQGSEHKGKSANDFKVDEDEGVSMQTFNKPVSLENLPNISESSLLLSEKTRSSLYHALPVLVQGRIWVLLYSTWRHGISLSTLYRRSLLCPGLTLLIVGDRKGAVFGGLVEAPLSPSTQKKYQGTKDSFVFTSLSGNPAIYRPTGMNRYFTLCSLDSLALGGGNRFALYLHEDLLSGSSSASETYGNPCLASSEDFDVKEIELWGFVYPSKYEETVSLLRTEAPGICRW